MANSHVVLLILPALVTGQTAMTGCQTCCSPGGSCAQAHSGSLPGQCCGSVGGNSYCCPIQQGGLHAKCWPCASEYRCYTGARPSPNICVMSGGNVGGSRYPSSHYGSHSQADPAATMFIVLIGIIILGGACYACAQTSRVPLAMQQEMVVMPGGVKPGVGVPVAMAQPACCGGPAMCAGPAMYPAGYPGGYGGGIGPGMAGGMGFLGGMMVGEALADHGHYGGGYGGGGYGDGCGGGEFGGGGGEMGALGT